MLLTIFNFLIIFLLLRFTDGGVYAPCWAPFVRQAKIMTEPDVSPFPGDIRFRQFFDAVDELDIF